MRFFNKWFFSIGFFVIVVVFFYSSSVVTLCWDGLEVDEEQLMLDCGVDLQDYWVQLEIDETFCPEGQYSIREVGGCGPELGLVWLYLGLSAIVYIILYGGIFLILRKRYANKNK
jgi:hypothetical protein